MLQKAADNSYEYTGVEKHAKTKTKAKNNFRVVIIYALALLILGVFLVLYFAQSFHINGLDRQLHQMETELIEVKEENKKYRLELARNSSLSRIEKIAREEMNMVEPGEVEIVVMKQNTDSNEGTITPDNNMFVIQFLNDMLTKIGTVSAGSPE